MTYIIGPMWFYWLGVVDALQDVVFASLLISILIFCTSAVVYFINLGSFHDDTDAKAAKRIMKLSFIFLVIFGLLFLFLPTKDTLIEMQVAKLATVENAEWTVDAVKSAVDYIVEAIKSIG